MIKKKRILKEIERIGRLLNRQADPICYEKQLAWKSNYYKTALHETRRCWAAVNGNKEKYKLVLEYLMTVYSVENKKYPKNHLNQNIEILKELMNKI